MKKVYLILLLSQLLFWWFNVRAIYAEPCAGDYTKKYDTAKYVDMYDDLGANFNGKYFSSLSNDYAKKIKSACDSVGCWNIINSGRGAGTFYCYLSRNLTNSCNAPHRSLSCSTDKNGDFTCKCAKIIININSLAECKSICAQEGAISQTWLGSAKECTCIFSEQGGNISEIIKVRHCDYDGDTQKDDGIETSIGCIPTDTTPFIGWLLRWGISIGSGVAFLLMAIASFKLMTSSGNPEAIKDGKEMFVSAGAGLLLIILSMFLLRLIGVEILQIPGFN